MKPHILMILFACVIVVNSQNLQQPQSAMDILCGTGETRPSGHVLNPRIIFIELPAYPQKAQQKRIEGRVWVQVLINEDGEVIAATPITGSEHLWAAALKASVTARFEAKTVLRESGKLSGILMFYFRNGKVELDKLPDPRNITGPPVRRGIPRP